MNRKGLIGVCAGGAILSGVSTLLFLHSSPSFETPDNTSIFGSDKFQALVRIVEVKKTFMVTVGQAFGGWTILRH